MKVAITGANGFLGSYLVKECLRQKMEVHALLRIHANTSLLPITTSERLITHVLDYEDELTSQFAFLKKKIGELDYFIHNAGITVSLKSKEYYQVNVGVTTSIINALDETDFLRKKGTFIYISSYAAHGPATVKQPVSHYGSSKLQAEQVIQKKLPNYLLVRSTAIYGAGDVAFLPLFKCAKLGIYPVTDSHQRMSMIHGKDLAKMIIRDMQTTTGILHYNDGYTYFHQDIVNVFHKLFHRKIRKFLLPKWLMKLSLGLSDVWCKMINKRPGITLEKFDEISQHWDLHATDLKHSSIKTSISLEEGFKDALRFYKKKCLI